MCHGRHSAKLLVTCEQRSLGHTGRLDDIFDGYRIRKVGPYVPFRRPNTLRARRTAQGCDLPRVGMALCGQQTAEDGPLELTATQRWMADGVDMIELRDQEVHEQAEARPGSSRTIEDGLEAHR